MGLTEKLTEGSFEKYLYTFFVNLYIKQCFISIPNLLLPLVEHFQKTIYFSTIQTHINIKKSTNFRQEFV